MPITGPDRGCLEAAGLWTGAPRETPRLRLRPLIEADCPRLVALAGEANVARMTAFIPHPFNDRDAIEFLAKAAIEEQAGKARVFAIERRLEPGLIGCVAFAIEDTAAEFSYWIGKPYWRQGFALEAMGAIIDFVFRNGAVAEATAQVMEENLPSARLLENAGFQFRGPGTGCGGRCSDRPIRLYGLTREAWMVRQSKKPMVLVVAVALVDSDGRVLIAKRPAGKTMAGLWEFPGGKVKTGELPETALMRELAEELAVDITESCLAPFTFASHVYADFHLLMPIYVCRVWKGTPTPKEGQEIKWVKPIRLGDYAMPPADAPLVAMLRDLL
jgi:8-oxo-dGTP diphosphatase